MPLKQHKHPTIFSYVERHLDVVSLNYNYEAPSPARGSLLASQGT